MGQRLQLAGITDRAGFGGLRGVDLTISLGSNGGGGEMENMQKTWDKRDSVVYLTMSSRGKGAEGSRKGAGVGALSLGSR
jgi:hypothetical protein